MFETLYCCLSPLFELDHLLPRTFIASMDYNHAVKWLSTGNFPPEVTLANICYFAKTLDIDDLNANGSVSMSNYSLSS